MIYMLSATAVAAFERLMTGGDGASPCSYRRRRGLYTRDGGGKVRTRQQMKPRKPS